MIFFLWILKMALDNGFSLLLNEDISVNYQFIFHLMCMVVLSGKSLAVLVSKNGGEGK